MPRGMAMIAVSPNIQAVPVQTVSIPARSARREGRLVKKSQSIRLMPSSMMSPRKITSTMIPKNVQVIPTYLNIESIILLVRILLIFFLIPFLQPETQVVQQEYKQKQSDARGKYRL